MNGAWKGALTLLVLLGTSGCYRYVPVELDATPPGTEVQLLVTRNGAREAEEAGAMDDGEPRLRGTVVNREGNDLFLRVPVAVRQDGFIMNRIDQSIRVPVGEIVSVQRRELNGLATGLLVTGAAAVVGGLVALIADPLGGDQPEPDPPPDDFFDFAIFSLPFTFGR